MVTPADYDGLRPVQLSADGNVLRLLDQRRIPAEESWLELTEVEPIAVAIEELAVRGAPAIGCAAAFGLAAASVGFPEDGPGFRAKAAEALERLANTRPTAVNLFVAIEQLKAALAAAPDDADKGALRATIRATAQAHVEHDLAMCLAIGKHGSPLLPDEGGVLTHCNTGALATAGFGTALGVLRQAWADGKKIHVYADETRPVLQGARLTSWELHREKIPVSVLCDNMAGALMAQGKIKAAIVGADRITANGDAANKIGTYTVAVLCKHHGIPFYVAAPMTTVDFGLATGAEIPIEQRNPDEVRYHGKTLMTPADVPVENPAFDVTPAELITKIITDRGVHDPGDLPRG